MKEYTSLITAAVLSLVLGIVLSAHMHARKKSFDGTVRQALETSEGYDQRFIDMVNRLEEVLATRASFGYIGRKDPMTGKVRTVVRPPRKPPRPRKVEKAEPAEPVDPFKLTALIYDDQRRTYTAIMMHDERSYAVDVGDVVADRRIVRITDERVYMEDDSARYYYDISGKKARSPKR